MRDYVSLIIEYCNNVLNDNLENRSSCELEKLACERHLNDLSKQNDEDFPYYFDDQACINRCYFTECLQHVKGKWANRPLILEPHQIFMQGVLFGWLKKKNNLRRFTKAYIAIPRKNGKSLDVASTGLFMAFCDNEYGSEVYAAAGTEAQAHMVFGPAWKIVKNNEEIRDYFNLKLSGTLKNPTSIYCEDDMSMFIPIVGKPGDGANPNCGIVDEYHESPHSDAYDTLDTGMGSRDQPLLIVITTAGTNTSYPCYDLHLEAVKVLKRTYVDDSLFTMIFAPDEKDNWEDFEVWKKVNPNYGVSINEDYLWGKYQDALNKPSQRNILLTKHLNIWQNAGVGFIDMLRWQKGCDSTLSLDNFLGQECWLALDLASKIDLAALVLLFNYKRKVVNETCPKCYGKTKVVLGLNVCVSKQKLEDGTVCRWRKPVLRNCVAGFARHYIPEETVRKKENQHYRKWAESGNIVVTEGARTDFQKIENDIRNVICKNFVVKELTFDPKEASYLIQNIEKWSSFECIEFEQGPVTISEPMKELEAMVYANEFWHNGDPVYTWCMGNIIKKKARSGGSVKHYFPTKTNDSLKIDSGVATICALGRLKTYDDDGAYESRKHDEGPILRTL